MGFLQQFIIIFNLLTFLILSAISCQIPTSFLLYYGWHSTNQQKKKEMVSCDFLPFPHIQIYWKPILDSVAMLEDRRKRLEKGLKSWRESTVLEMVLQMKRVTTELVNRIIRLTKNLSTILPRKWGFLLIHFRIINC